MSTAEVAADRAELLQRPRPRMMPRDLADARMQLGKVRHARQKFGERCVIPVGREEELEQWITEHGAQIEPEQVGSQPVWLEEPVALHPSSRVRVLGYIEGTVLPDWLAAHINS